MVKKQKLSYMINSLSNQNNQFLNFGSLNDVLMNPINRGSIGYVTNSFLEESPYLLIEENLDELKKYKKI